jgi:ABC-2 type transport system ATP-binding protein
MPVAIEIRDLKKAYRARGNTAVQALDGVSFDIEAGRIYGLLGPNGAGKSTLVKIISTITEPTSGRVSVLGFDVERYPLAARRQMAVVLQQTATEGLLTVRDNLVIYGTLHGLGMREARQRAARVAEEFDLGESLRKTVMDLSLGTKRRIQVAKMFMLETPLIILDEATTGMDPIMKHRVMNRLRAEAAAGRTILLTTQVLSEAEELCDTITILNKGVTLASGTLDELRRLSTRMFRVSLVFGETADDVEYRLRELNPIELKINGRSADLLFEGEEASLLGRLADISRSAPITQFEVHGPDLEEIFLTLLKEPRRSHDERTAVRP